ncbi:nitrogen regulation protein NR(I) [Thermithiobacillus plumbiphilus]|uniref:DNA-binding transcriptional regulator NtrC n=1 Tax=Thermithiobacillus plumbiphilus TaxID=1729899 RepID=A0ABU9D742_9PROT
MKPVWVIDDDHSIRWVLEKALEGAGIPVESFASAAGIIERLHREQPSAIISDVRMPGMNGLDLLQRIQKQWPHLPVIITTAHSDLDSAVAAFQGGAFEYLPKPFDVDEAISLARRAMEHQSPAQEEPSESFAPREILGEAPAMQEVFRAIGRLSRSHINVLINGESGTGKELVAHALHRHSPRANAPFIAINTAAIPAELLESELFGHERGAFTGAVSQRHGRFEQANGGTLFLDEIGDMPAGLQTRLLRVLADGEFYRVGGHTPIRVNVRVIAATHQHLERLVQEGRFREDLFHRLNVIRIQLPALRERREDVPQLARHFLAKSAQELGVERKRLSAAAEEALTGFGWPGNVRQLENVCRWLTVMAPAQVVQVHDLPPEIHGADKAGEPAIAIQTHREWDLVLADWARMRLRQGQENLLEEAGPRFERTLLEVALAYTQGHKQEAARKLGWGRNTLTRKLRELGMDHGEEDEHWQDQEQAEEATRRP